MCELEALLIGMFFIPMGFLGVCVSVWLTATALNR